MKLARSGLSPARTFIMLLQPPSHQSRDCWSCSAPQSSPITTALAQGSGEIRKPERSGEEREVKARKQFADDYDGWRRRLAAAAK